MVIATLSWWRYGDAVVIFQGFKGWGGGTRQGEMGYNFLMQDRLSPVVVATTGTLDGVVMFWFTPISLVMLW